MSKTIFTLQEGPANALCLNKDYSQVVIAGRNVFKIFSIEEDEFVEVYNLRVGKNINLNYSCNDVVWSHSDDNILATAATNGAVVVWNLSRATRSKQDHVFIEHERTVNKVCFSLLDPYWLMSGSQDGTIKLFDLRNHETIKTFVSNTESVRDVQFSPQIHFNFASVSENGHVQLWDLRRPEKCILQFTAHAGPIFSCDWHPDMPWLATASRDKTIKVWDMSVKPTAEFSIHTIASVGRVKWRPLYKYHLTSAALVVDSSINVWDVRRPYLAFATFTQHRDVTTCLAWKDSFSLLSTSRDCSLFLHSFKDSIDPSSTVNPHGLAISCSGQVAFATKSLPSSIKTSRVPTILKKVGNIASGTNLTNNTELESFNSSVFLYTRINKETEGLVTCAKRYILTGKSLADICDHNAKVTLDCGRFSVSQVWKMVKMVYTGLGKEYWEKSTERDTSVSADQLGLDSEENYDSKIGELHFRDLPCNDLDLVEEKMELDWNVPQEAFSSTRENQEALEGTTCVTEPSQQIDEDEYEGPHLGTCQPPPADHWDPMFHLASAMSHHAYLSDVQTPVCVLTVLGEDAAAPIMRYIDPDVLETWTYAYVDLLCRFKLWIHSTQIVKLSWLPLVNGINQDSTTVHTSCSSCNKPLTQTGWKCARCLKLNRCSVCHNIVRGMFAWCQGCQHGGHLHHMKQWFEKRTICPTGCGHACQYS